MCAGVTACADEFAGGVETSSTGESASGGDSTGSLGDGTSEQESAGSLDETHPAVTWEATLTVDPDADWPNILEVVASPTGQIYALVAGGGSGPVVFALSPDGEVVWSYELDNGDVESTDLVATEDHIMVGVVATSAPSCTGRDSSIAPAGEYGKQRDARLVGGDVASQAGLGKARQG